MSTPSEPPLFSSATAAALELPGLLAVVAELTATDLGRRHVEGLEPFPREEDLRRHARRFEEASRLVEERPLVTSFETPLSELLEALSDPRASVDGRALMRLADLLRATEECRRRIAAVEPPAPALAERVEPLPDLAPLVRRIRGALDRRGRVREDASPKLAALRERIRRVRDGLYSSLKKIVESDKDSLSEETVPMRNGRLMLMLSAGAKGRRKGLVHGRSGTGRSFYFEPLEVVDANNDLQGATEDEEAEKARILAELAAEARGSLSAIEEHAQLLAELDGLQASVRLAERVDGRLAELAPRHGLRLAGARHPLLHPALTDLRERALGQPGHSGDVVPLDLELTAESRALVVTGPNAGGKTVVLKTAGLLCAAALCGLPLPVASGTRIPFFRRLVATVGDDQDLLTDQSTFSGRLLRLKEAWEEAGPDSLVLLDELGSGTDPEEGAALSVALLEGLLERSSLTLISTHLTPLVVDALDLSGAACAAMEFDADTGAPTYRLQAGPPGGSEALALARRLGLPAAWLDRAEERLGSQHRDLRRLLAEVEELRRDLGRERERLAGERAEIGALRERLESELEAAEEETRRVGRRLKSELEEFRVKTRRQLAAEVERLREELAAGRRRGLERAAEERLFESAPELAGGEEEGGPAPVVGGTVRHGSLGWQGTLEAIKGERAEVRVTGKRVRCRLDELVGVEEVAQKKASRGRATGRRPRPAAAGYAEREVAAELNLIGQRVEPALIALDSYLDDALLSTRREIRVVHGFGTGRLRDAVRERLRGHPAVVSFRSGRGNEGGDGATVVMLEGTE